MALPVSPFDYAGLPANVVKEARAAADRIRKRHASQIRAIIETGKDLLRVKDSLEHGQFGRWLRAEFQMTERTAQNYMNAAAMFGEKSETISHLPPTMVYAVAAPSTPEPVRKAVFAKIDAGQPIEAAEVRKDLDNARWAETRAAMEANAGRSRRRPRVKPSREAIAKIFDDERAAKLRDAKRCADLAERLAAAVKSGRLDPVVAVLREIDKRPRFLGSVIEALKEKP
jgi:hypothetical protein